MARGLGAWSRVSRQLHHSCPLPLLARLVRFASPVVSRPRCLAAAVGCLAGLASDGSESRS
jgi:hypothetical protein